MRCASTPCAELSLRLAACYDLDLYTLWSLQICPRVVWLSLYSTDHVMFGCLLLLSTFVRLTDSVE